PSINPYIFVRGDSWLHAGFAVELMDHGFPPEDPRMAGVRMSYVWFFNLFVALLSSIRNQDAFRFMTLSNSAAGFATVPLVAGVPQRVWKDARATTAGCALLVLGLNAGAWLLWPINLARALTGAVRGTPEVLRQLHGIELGTARIIYSLSAPLADMLS